MAIRWLVYEEKNNNLDDLNLLLNDGILSMSDSHGYFPVLEWDDAKIPLEDVNVIMLEKGFSLFLNSEYEIKSKGTTSQRPSPEILPNGFSYMDVEQSIKIYASGGKYKDDFSDTEILREGLVAGSLYCRNVTIG